MFREQERKVDKSMRKHIIVFAVSLAVALTMQQSCGSNGPTAPDPAPAPAPPVVHTAVIPAAPVAPSPEVPNNHPNPGPNSITFREDGSATACTTATGSDKWITLFYTEVLNEAVRYIPDQRFLIPKGGCVEIPPAIDVMGPLLIPDEGCDPWSWKRSVQIDATAGQGEHIGHVFVDVSLSREAGEGSWVEQEAVYGDWTDVGECIASDLDASTREACYGRQEQHRSKTVTWINSCTEKTREVVTREKRQVRCEIDCPCVEWDEPKITREFKRGEWGECAPKLTASSGGGGAECKRWRDVTVTITRTWNCKDPEVVVQQKRESEACDCPVDQSLCHISNKGGGGPNNNNLVITRNGHSFHTVANGFCPQDLPLALCSCENAIQAATACSDVATGGFTCKDTRTR